MNPGVAQAIDNISTWLQLIITVGAVVTLFLTVGKAAQKPNQTQDQRLDEHDKRLRDIEERLDIGNKHFAQVDEGERVTQKALLALMSHAINGNDVDKLKDAKDSLEAYLLDK
jgi:uncharacterized Ntn-hydrolase superfamily protein